MIHARSRRSGGPFVVMNCATLNRGRFEEELFGMEAGSDVMAHPRRAGVLERAHTGTLLLDEVSDMPLETEGKIVRALQDQTFERLGGSARVKVDVRVLSTTNRDLQAEIAAGRFREDLPREPVASLPAVYEPSDSAWSRARDRGQRDARFPTDQTVLTDSHSSALNSAPPSIPGMPAKQFYRLAARPRRAPKPQNPCN